MNISNVNSFSSLQATAHPRDLSQIEINQRRAVEAAAKEVMEGFCTRPRGGPIKINQWDKSGNWLRYDIPHLSLGDYISSAKRIASLYYSVGCGLILYDPMAEVQCYATVYFRKSYEQAEDDYEKILTERKISERHALHTDTPMSWLASLDRRWNHSNYVQRSEAKRAKQLAGLERIRQAWKKTGLFKDVIVPDINYRIDQLGQYPEHVATSDEIFFLFKPLDPDFDEDNEQLIGQPLEFPKVVTPTRPLRYAQKSNRAEYDAKIWHRVTSVRVTSFFASCSWFNRSSPSKIEEIKEEIKATIPAGTADIEAPRLSSPLIGESTQGRTGDFSNGDEKPIPESTNGTLLIASTSTGCDLTGIAEIKEVTNNERSGSTPNVFPESGDALATASRASSDVCEAAFQDCFSEMPK
ncbi:MAG: hypothetical protein HW387_1180 [Parachlamydiales bacterium]|nr:hypothetical protein [Parachlamydiales bacterium]